VPAHPALGLYTIELPGELAMGIKLLDRIRQNSGVISLARWSLDMRKLLRLPTARPPGAAGKGLDRLSFFIRGLARRRVGRKSWTGKTPASGVKVEYL